MATTTPLRHGYTLTDLDRLAHAAVCAAFGQAGDYRDRHDAAWHAIAVRLYAAGDAPRPGELKRIGIRAINDHITDEGHHHGVDRNTPYSGRESMRAYRRYWWDITRATPSPENRIIERIALPQILSRLTPPARAAIDALAVHGDYQAAANALGLDYYTFTTRIRRARGLLLRLWHEGQRPPPHRRDRRVQARGHGLATHCAAGHEWTVETTRTRYRIAGGTAKTERVCRACESERAAQRRTRAA